MTNIITKAEFISIIKHIKGCQFAAVVYTTDIEAMNKKFIGGKKNPYNGRVSSVTEIGVQIGYSYENAVNNRTDEEFKAQPLPWGEWLRPNYLIEHKGNTYLRAYKVKGQDATIIYRLDGNMATIDQAKDINANIRQSAPSARQSEVGIAESEQVKPLTINIANITYAVINKVRYIIQD